MRQIVPDVYLGKNFINVLSTKIIIYRLSIFRYICHSIFFFTILIFMRVTGFTFIKNALTYDYPVVEAIRSILPLCDDFIVAVGASADDTRNLIAAIDSDKIQIIDTEWDESLRMGGLVLAQETDKAFAAIPKETDWAFYIQGDEVLHEQYLPVVREAMTAWLDQPQVEGLLFKYKHFYGSYDYVGTASNWYPREIRVIRNDKRIYSYRDAQGFRKGANQKLNVKVIDAYIYHYGWVKPPETMQLKQKNFHKYWHDDEWIDEHVIHTAEYDYKADIDTLEKFNGTHPEVMLPRIIKKNWIFDYDLSFNRMTLKERMKRLIFRLTGIELGYKNYKKI